MKPISKSFWVALVVLGTLFPTTLPAATTSPGVQAAPTQASAPSRAPLPMAGDLHVEISSIEGVVWVQTAGSSDFVDARQVKILHMGDTVRAEDGSCRLLIDQKITIDVSPQTTLEITAALREPVARDHEKTELSMLSGQIRAKLAKAESDFVFEVTTPTAIAAARGTTFFLKIGTFNGQPGSQLYVDETAHGVDFINLISKKSFHVPAFSLSHALADGTLDKPRRLTKEQKEDFLKNWNQNRGRPAQQFGVEEMPLNNIIPTPPPDLFAPLKEPFLKEAMLDHFVEQNLAGVNGLPGGPGFVGGGAGTKPKDPPKEEDTHSPPPPPTDEKPTEEPTPDPTPSEVLDAQERSMIREQIGGFLDDQNFDRADAYLAQIVDAQTGKVFTDVHGNRVRVNQYLFSQEIAGANAVELLSLTARTGSYQNGVSALAFIAFFNRPIESSDGPLKDLPWNDWMRVVESSQLTGAESLPVFNQFIVHEHHSDQENAPDLFPVDMTAIFTNPGTLLGNSFGALVMNETYTTPEFVQADQGNFWVQGMSGRSLIVAGGAQYTDLLTVIETPSQTIAQVNNAAVSFSRTDGAQTAGLANDPRLAQLDTPGAFNAFSNSLVRPAYFENRLGDNHLIAGIFLPINDQGQVLDVPGFKVHGLRDLVFPNSSVNGGQYNLETIFLVGTRGEAGFAETFRVDTIITPEIFSNYGLKGPGGSRDNSSVFSSDSSSQNV